MQCFIISLKQIDPKKQALYLLEPKVNESDLLNIVDNQCFMCSISKKLVKG